jgi:hypothetical protein
MNFVSILFICILFNGGSADYVRKAVNPKENVQSVKHHEKIMRKTRKTLTSVFKKHDTSTS